MLDKLIDFFRALSVSSAQPKPKIFTTIEESQNNKIETWKENQDLINGLEFCATMQIRTPLRVLLRHGEVHTDKNTEPPKIAMEMWEGIWVTKIKTWRELGFNVDEFSPSTTASDIGLVKASEYLPFLIAIRSAIETPYQDIAEVTNRIIEVAKNPQFSSFVAGHGGVDGLINKVAPNVISCMQGISTPIKQSLAGAGLDTIAKIDATTDAELLKLNGMGNAGLVKLRKYCEAFEGDRSAQRQEIS